MSKALDSTSSVQDLVKQWKEEDIDIVLEKIGEIVDNPKSSKSDKMLSQFASIGAMYIQARRLQLGLGL